MAIEGGGAHRRAACDNGRPVRRHCSGVGSTGAGRERTGGYGLDFVVPQMHIGSIISDCGRKSNASKNEVKLLQKHTKMGPGYHDCCVEDSLVLEQ